ncbi:MAG: beta-glucosidase [Hyphomicrobiaceae bacterium]|nr:beta-glucosidase [Hyphomicrobiaceae bacterium]
MVWRDLEAVDPQFVYRGDRSRYVRFPLGGIGSGGLAISGSGRLVDWSIRNRPALGSYNGYSHFAIKAERDGELLDARILNGPYDDNPSGGFGMRDAFDGFGHGAMRQSLAGLPHFARTCFYGRFPAADLTFADPHFPGEIRLTAFSPFIPHDERTSSLPVAMFEFELVNKADHSIDYTIAGTLGNCGDNPGGHAFASEEGISTITLGDATTASPGSLAGDLTIATDAVETGHQNYHFRGQWFDDLTVFWKDFARPGPLPARHYATPRPSAHMGRLPEHATLTGKVTIAPGASATMRFVIAWNFPEGDIHWAFRDRPDGASRPGETPHWRNYYATQWQNSADSARAALRGFADLKSRTLAFRDALFGSSAPAPIIDAASATLALLRTATVIRLEDGALWAWEGQHRLSGSCEGSCTHVWNYQQALSNLFPALERTLRDTEWAFNQLPSGGLTFRQKLPLGSGFDVIGPCADGHFGAIIKTYRDWRVSGDTEWLRRLWPNVRKAVEYAWSPDNPDLWDPGETGILSGRQHQTLDMELFGPNSWLASFYVAALFAAAGMAEVVGDKDFAEKCERLGSAGARFIDETLFNGRYYIQAVDLDDRDVLKPFETSASPGVLTDGFAATYWSDEHAELKYQAAGGCLADQILGQWHADLVGLGGFLDSEKVRTALLSVYRENFVRNMGDMPNPCRVFAFEDEAGLVIATYPEGVRQPVVPIPYAEECWTGIEYAAASHMIMRGLVDEGLDIVTAVRRRYDGMRRNPFNEIECGSYYSRSMSAWQLVNAWSGFRADQVDRTLHFAPVKEGDLTLFWSAGQAWGQLIRRGGEIELRVLGGKLDIDRVIVDGVEVAWTLS